MLLDVGVLEWTAVQDDAHGPRPSATGRPALVLSAHSVSIGQPHRAGWTWLPRTTDLRFEPGRVHRVFLGVGVSVPAGFDAEVRLLPGAAIWGLWSMGSAVVGPGEVSVVVGCLYPVAVYRTGDRFAELVIRRIESFEPRRVESFSVPNEAEG